MPQVVTRAQLASHIGQLAMRGQRCVLVIDGYPGSGKTTLAMALARQPGVAWAPLDGYRLGESFDFKKLNRDLLKPFRKRGRVREVRPVNPLNRSGPMRLGDRRPHPAAVLVLEGMHAAQAFDLLGGDFLCWVDCEREQRIARVDAREVVGGTFVELREWIEQAERTGLREFAMPIAQFVLDTSR